MIILTLKRPEKSGFWRCIAIFVFHKMGIWRQNLVIFKTFLYKYLDLEKESPTFAPAKRKTGVRKAPENVRRDDL